MKSILFASAIGLAAALAAPASAHVPSQCHPHLRELLDLRIKKHEMRKSAAEKTLELFEKRKDFVFCELEYLVVGGLVRSSYDSGEPIEPEVEVKYDVLKSVCGEDAETENRLEQEALNLIDVHMDVHIFDKTRAGKALDDWIACLADFKDTYPGHEELPLLLDEVRTYLDTR